MAKRKPGLSLIPWEGGLVVDGAADIKHPSALSIAENIVYDHAGAKKRRGGQVHLHRVPIREGSAFEDHFLDPDLDERRWPTSLRTVDANHFLTGHRRSSVRVSQRSGTSGGTTSIQNVTKGDSVPENKMKYLVETLSSDRLTAAGQATMISIQVQFTAEELPFYTTAIPDEQYFGIEVEPGRPGGSNEPEWHFHCRFGQSLMGIRNEAGSFALVSFDSPYNLGELIASGITQSRTNGLITFRWDIKRNADVSGIRHYVCDMYFMDRKVATSIPIDNDSVAGTAFAKLEWDTTNMNRDLDFSVDSFDVQAELQEIRGLFEFSEDPTDIEGATRKRAVYAGSRVYLDIGNPFYIPCIDDGLDRDQFCAFEVFESRIRPFRLDSIRQSQGSGI